MDLFLGKFFFFSPRLYFPLYFEMSASIQLGSTLYENTLCYPICLYLLNLSFLFFTMAFCEHEGLARVTKRVYSYFANTLFSLSEQNVQKIFETPQWFSIV